MSKAKGEEVAKSSMSLMQTTITQTGGDTEPVNWID
eukprot:COSAG02_NODE_871_length_16337_cov_7.124276_3_plen_36_part_00